MAHLTGIQDNTYEEGGDVGRKVKVSELRKGMRVACKQRGWRSEVTVFGVESPEQGGISSWTVYADNNGTCGDLHCFHSSTEFEVLKEAPVPPEPGANSIVRIGTVDYRNTGGDDSMSWHRLHSRLTCINGIPMLSHQGWTELVGSAARAGVEIEVVYEPIKTEGKYKKGDVLDKLPEDTGGLEGYVFRDQGGDYMYITPGGWRHTSVLEWAKRGSDAPALVCSTTLKSLNLTESPFTVVAAPEDK